MREREFLKELGLEDAVIDKIMAEHGKDVETFKNQVSTGKTELETIKGQLAEANKKIESFKDLDVDSIKKEAQEYKEKYEKLEKEGKEKLEELKFSHALDNKLSGTKAKDINIIKSLLNRDNLKLAEDGSIIGFDDQISKIKEEKGFLLDSEDDKDPKVVTGGTGGSGGGATAKENDIRELMGLDLKK